MVLRVVSLSGLSRVLKGQISYDLPVWVLACFHGCCLHPHAHPLIPSHLLLGSDPKYPEFSGCLDRAQDHDSSHASLCRGWPQRPLLITICPSGCRGNRPILSPKQWQPGSRQQCQQWLQEIERMTGDLRRERKTKLSMLFSLSPAPFQSSWIYLH